MPWPGTNSEAQFTQLSLPCVIKASTALESKYMDVEFIPIIKLLRSVRVNHSIKQSSPCISRFSAVVPWEQAAKNDKASNHVARAENGDNG